MKQKTVMPAQKFKINDLFYTMQGEGKHWGRRSLFIRLPFCNLNCPWCDTEFNSFTFWTSTEFIRFIDKSKEKTKFCVLTGGEPAMNKDLPHIISLLKEKSFEIAIESNGNFNIDDRIDFVTISPKAYTQNGTNKEPFYICDNAWERANEFKYVVYKGFDFTVLDKHNLKDGRIYSLSPEFSDMQNQIEAIESYIKVNPGWKLNLQTHKWIGKK